MLDAAQWNKEDPVRFDDLTLERVLWEAVEAALEDGMEYQTDIFWDPETERIVGINTDPEGGPIGAAAAAARIPLGRYVHLFRIEAGYDPYDWFDIDWERVLRRADTLDYVMEMALDFKNEEVTGSVSNAIFRLQRALLRMAEGTRQNLERDGVSGALSFLRASSQDICRQAFPESEVLVSLREVIEYDPSFYVPDLMGEMSASNPEEIQWYKLMDENLPREQALVEYWRGQHHG